MCERNHEIEMMCVTVCGGDNDVGQTVLQLDVRPSNTLCFKKQMFDEFNDLKDEG